MARLNYVPSFTGTRDGICIYFMRGKFYMQTASTLTRERVKKKPEFRETMKWAGLLGRASKIASHIYNTLPQKTRKHETYRLMTGEAMRMLKLGAEENEIAKWLKKWMKH